MSNTNTNGRIGFLAAAVTGVMIAAPAFAATTVIDQTPTLVGPPVNDVWYNTSVNSGAASIVDLTGVGGNLENNAPLPSGAVRVTTTSNVPDKAELSTMRNFGAAATTLSSINLGYDFYKASGGDIAPAPSVKITITGPGTGDNFGQLVYEPYVNPTFNTPTPDVWTSVSITPTSGLFWWTGGYEIGSSFGGPPYKTLSQWAIDFAASDATDFANAAMTVLTIGVGSNNLNQVGYFDNVSVDIPTIMNTTYDFQTPVPEPTGIALLGLGAGALLLRRRSRSHSA